MWYMEHLQGDLKLFAVLSIPLPLGVVFSKKSWHLERSEEKFCRHFQDILLSSFSKNIPIECENWEHALKNKIKIYIVSLESLVLGGEGCVPALREGTQMHGFWTDKAVGTFTELRCAYDIKQKCILNSENKELAPK